MKKIKIFGELWNIYIYIYIYVYGFKKYKKIRNIFEEKNWKYFENSIKNNIFIVSILMRIFLKNSKIRKYVPTSAHDI